MIITGACAKEDPPVSDAKQQQQAGQTRRMVMTRRFEAPPEKVWKAWTDGEQVKRWWGPTGFTCPVAEMDVRAGGASLVCMRAPAHFGGQDMYNTWTYTKVDQPRRLEYVLRFTDKDRGVLDPAAIGLPPGLPKEVPHTVELKDLGGGRTEVTITESGYTDDDIVKMSEMGLAQCLDKMAASLAAP